MQTTPLAPRDPTEILSETKKYLKKIDKYHSIEKAYGDELENYSSELLKHREKILKGRGIGLIDPKTEELFNKIATAVNQRLETSYCKVEALPPMGILPSETLDNLLERHPAYQNATKEEKEFLKTLTLKHLGHLMGDSFVLGMVDKWGAPIEGNSLLSVMNFFLVAMDYLPAKYPEKFKGKEEEIAKTKQILNDSMEIFEHLDRATAEKSLERKKNHLEQLLNKIKFKLESLEEGATTLLPWGWSDPSKTGHAILMSITKKNGDLYIEVFNTGEGIQYNEQTALRNDFKTNTISHYRIPFDQREIFYKDTLQALFEPKILGGMDSINGPMYNNQRYGAKELYTMIEPYRYFQGKDSQTQFLKGEQQSGTCAFQCVLAFVGKLTQGFDRDLKFLWEQEACSHLLDYHDLFLGMDPVYEIFLSRLNPNLFRHLEKLQKKDLPNEESSLLLQRLEEEKKKIEALSKPTQENNPSLSADTKPRWVAPKTLEKLEPSRPQKKDFDNNTEEQVKEIEKEKAIPLPLFSDSLAKMDPQEMVATLREKREFFKDKLISSKNKTFSSLWFNTIPDDLFLFENCHQVANFFTDPVYKENKEALLEKLKNDPLLLDQLLNELSLLTIEVQENALFANDVADPIAMEGLRLVIFELGVLKDDQLGFEGAQRIDHYGLKFGLSLESLGLTSISFNTPQAENEYEKIKRTYEDRFPTQKASLCDIQAMQFYGGSRNICFKYDSKVPDFQYAANFVSLLGEEDLKKAHNGYIKFIKENSKSQVKESDWLICWLYSNENLPLHYRALLNASLTINLSNPNSRNIKSGITSANELYLQKDYDDPKGLVIYTNNINYEDPLHLRVSNLLTPYSSKIASTFPKYSNSAEGDKIPLFGVPQNAGMCVCDVKLKEIFSMSSVSHPLQITMLLDYYRQSPELLNQLEHQIYFEVVLFSPTRLSTALKKNPVLAQDLTRFFEDINKQIISRKIKLSDIEEIHSVHAFALEQKARVDVALDRVGMLADGSFIKTRKEIQALLEKPDIQDPEITLRLYFALITTYASSNSWNEDIVFTALSLFQKAQQYLIGSEEFKKIGSESYWRASKIILEHLKEITNTLNSEESKSLIESMLPGNQVLEWKVKSFPLLSVRTVDGWQVLHLFTGENYMERKETKMVPTNYLSSNYYQMLFQKKRVAAEVKEDHSLITHSSGNYTIWHTGWMSVKSIEKFIEGKNYTLATARDVGMDFVPEVQDWQFWRNSEESPSETLIHDKNGLRLGYMTEEGVFHMDGPPPCSYKYAKEIQWESPFFEFSKPLVITQKIDQNGKITKEMKLSITDENGDPLKFFKSGNRWFFEKDPGFFIADEQKIVGIQLHQKFLILQNSQGQKMALIPEITQAELAQKVKEKAKTYSYVLIALTKNNEIALQSSPYKNSFIAYQLMMNAKKPQDYLVVLQYLKGVQEFRPYTDQELKMLGLIVFSDKEKQNDDPEAYAIRLYAAYHLYDNLHHYPLETTNIGETQPVTLPKASDSEKDWSQYIRQKLNQKLNKAGLSHMMLPYMRKNNNLPNNLKIEKFIPHQDLEEWGWFNPLPLHSNEKLSASTKLPVLDSLRALDPPKDPKSRSNKSKFPDFYTRPGDITPYFLYMYKLACSPNGEDRHEVFNFLQKARFDDNERNKQLRSVLTAALEAQNPQSTAYKKAKQFIQMFDGIFYPTTEKEKTRTEKYSDPYYRKHRQFEKLGNAYAKFYRKYSHTTKKEKAGGVESLRFFIPPGRKETSLELPTSPVQISLPYAPNIELFASFQQIAAQYFQEPPATHEKPATLFDEKIEAVQWLNEEYATGYRQNLEKQTVATLIDPQEAKQKLLGERKQIKAQNREDRKLLENLSQEIIKLGNSQLRETIKGKTKVGGGKKKHLSLDDLFLLVLQGNPQKIKKATGIKSETEQQELVDRCGSYLELEMRIRHSQEILSSLKELEAATEDNLSARLRTVQDLLAAPYMLVQHKNPLVQLTFQHFVDLNFYLDQVAGLDNMIDPDKDYFLQRATGAGKTLIFAHNLAYYKADGYHLSIHVSPTYQFASQIYEMSDRSRRALGQEARALVFQDSPEYFNVDYLTRLNRDIVQIIREGKYFNTTIVTLRTLRTAYIHSALEYYNNRDLNKEQREEIAPKKDLAREAVSKIRARGRLTFDEVHDAQNPKVILNKGVGEVVHLDNIHVELMALMLRLSIETKNEQGLPLIALKENKQAQATEEERKILAQTIVHYVTTDKEWLKRLDCENLTSEEVKQLREYLLNKDAGPPTFIKERIDSFVRVGNVITSLDHLLLCRQLIAGHWIFETLSRSVYEHHGIVYQQNQLPLSIPFTANLKPSKKSEFSDPYRMGLNTLIAYHVQGLNTEQTKDLIEHARMLALKEYEEQSEEDHNFSLQDSETARHFSKVMENVDPGISLFEVNLNDQKQVQKIQEALKSPEHSAIILLSDYVAANVLKKKALFTKQVSCNGMNTATMGRNNNGFSATIDNPHIAPVMDYRGRKTSVETEKGVYGQRVDILIRNHPSVYVMGNEAEDLFTDVFHKLPEEKRKKVRAIIDPGCHFRGMRNEEVADMMCKEMHDLDIKGVIFYDLETDRPYFKMKDNPAVVKPINSFKTKEVDGILFFVDLNVPVDEVAVLFSQDKSTGTNIPLMKDAVAISTVTENTKFFSKVQGDGRMRGMNKEQEVVTAIQHGALEQVAQVLDKPKIQDFQKGFVEDPDMIRDVILYTYCLRAKDLKEEDTILCMQNMQNTVQQYLLDKIYEDSSREKDVFTLCSQLFEEDIAIDLVRDFGIPKIPCEKEKYLDLMIEKLMAPLVHLKLPIEQVHILSETLQSIKKDYLPDLEPSISVSQAELDPSQSFKSKKTLDGTMVQVQEKKAIKVQEQLNIQEWIKEGTEESKEPASETPVTKELLFAQDFGSIILAAEPLESDDLNAIALKILKKMQKIITPNSPNSRLIVQKIENAYPNVSPDNLTFEMAVRISEIVSEFCNEEEKARLEKLIKPHRNKLNPSNFLVIPLDAALERKFPKMWESKLFSEELSVTANFVKTFKNGLNVQDEGQKPIFHVLMIQDEMPKRTKALILSASDAEHIAKIFESEEKLPNGRKMWLLRPQGDLAWPGPTDYNKKALLSDPEIRNLLVQVNFFAGNLYNLEQPHWQRALKGWLETLDNLTFAQSFFENSILRNTPKEDYLFSKTRKTFLSLAA